MTNLPYTRSYVNVIGEQTVVAIVGFGATDFEKCEFVKMDLGGEFAL